MSMKQKQVTIGEIEYTLQRPGLAWYHENNAKCAMPSGIPHQRKITKSYLEHVIVNPRVEIKDFDDLKGTRKTVSILIDEETEKYEEFELIHPGIVWFMNTTSKNMNNNGIPDPMMMRKEMLNKMIDGDIKISYFDQFDEGFDALEDLIGECQKFAVEGKFGELQDLLGECERFLTSRRGR